MDTENEYEDMRELLRYGSVRMAPMGLDRKIMDGVRALDKKHAGQRKALTSWLRFIALGLLVILLAKVFGSQVSWNAAGKVTVNDIGSLAEKSGEAARWLAEHIYYLLPLVLLIFRRGMRDQNV